MTAYAPGDVVLIKDGSKSHDGEIGVVAHGEDNDGDIMVDVGERTYWPCQAGELEKVRE